ncbi:zwei Ig domain protein zig-8-like isoform X1 [Tigriopus californicus]|uniref:zwei Ig domain protein zig-8-like isoform X1 n=1 Tax=Tigriopus californicus TaxID=6832 RepID=UPI0027DA9CFF|nr:zwei Ig domain protein zig-8-like isoform X1 [Tigriopus californicus]
MKLPNSGYIVAQKCGRSIPSTDSGKREMAKSRIPRGIRRSQDDITEDYDEIDRRSPPIFINNTHTKVIVAADRIAILECRVRNLDDRAVSWIRKADIHILTMGKIVYTTDKRFSIEHSMASDNWILKLRNAQVDDSGIYECQINTEPKRSKAYLLQVVESNAKIVGDRDVMVQVGSDINLTCKAQDTPEPPATVYWYKNGVRVDSLLARGGISVVTESRRRSSHLLVSKVTSEDAGNYTCAPANSKTDSVTVHVIQGADPRANVMASSTPQYQVPIKLQIVLGLWLLLAQR